MEGKKVNRTDIVNKLSGHPPLRGKKLSAGSSRTTGRPASSLRKPKLPSGIKKEVSVIPTTANQHFMKIPDENSLWCENSSEISHGDSSTNNEDLDSRSFSIDNEPMVSFISPRPASGIVLDNGYDISDNGLEELTNAFLTDFPEESTSFAERLELLDSFLHTIQQEAKPKPILKKRAQSAITKRQVVKQPTAEEEFREKFVRPYSAGTACTEYRKNSRYLKINRDDSTGVFKRETVEKEPDIVMEPMVFGFRTGKQMCVYDDISDNEQEEKTYTDLVVAQDSLEDVETEDNESDDPMAIPSTIQHFLPWQTIDVTEVIGVDPSECLVFLPSLQYLDGPLQVPPPPQRLEEELNYTEKIYPPGKKKKKKRYEHPWKMDIFDEWKCVHGANAVVTPRIQVIANSGEILHESCDGYRGPTVIRKEIQELEDLMKGEGTVDGCVVVQFQAEINQLQYSINEMLPRIQEIDRREELKRREHEREDMFGMKTFYRHHREVMKKIRHQHRLCKLELAAVEEELDLQDPDRLFSTHINRQSIIA